MGRSLTSAVTWGSFVAASLCVHAGVVAALTASGRSSAPVLTSAPPPGGETFDVDPSNRLQPVSDDMTASTERSEAQSESAQMRATESSAPEPSALTHLASQATTAASGSRPLLYGAVGLRYASDLPSTFARAFPQAASADPAWVSSPLGPAGWAIVTLGLDDAGHINDRFVEGAPSASLRHGIDLTLALLGTRVFTAQDRTTRLRITARVSRDDVHDGLHGDVFALSGGSFLGNVGSAFFALPGASGSGRRVDVELRQLR